MNAWILTAAGNLVNASSVTHVTMKPTADGTIAVGLSSASNPSKIVECADESQATTLRNRLAAALSHAYEVATLISIDESLKLHAVAL